MHPRPRLQEALAVLQQHAPDVIEEYHEMCESHGEFFAARFVIDVVDHFNHLMDKAVNG